MFTTPRSVNRPGLKSMRSLMILSISGMVLLTIIFLSSDFGSKALESQQESHLSDIPSEAGVLNDACGALASSFDASSNVYLGTIGKVRGEVLSGNTALDVSQWYNYSGETTLNGDNLPMDDSRIVKQLVKNFLIPPPKLEPQKYYHLSNPELKDTSMGQSEKIRNILKNRTNGFFIECGALDGETRSNTLFMERYLNWTGLLIEADPLNFAQMVNKKRRAWLSPTCLSKTPHPQIVSFKQDFNIGRISDNKIGDKQPGFVDVQCFPIYSYLLALNVTHVDYFSLDVEGDELFVLKTLPFDKVNIETLSVEFAHVDDGKPALKEFMEGKGYSVVAEVTHPDWLANDYIFVKNH